MPSKRKAFTGALMVMAAVALCGTVQARTVTIAVVRDGPSVEDSILPLIEEELGRLADADLVFKQAPEFDAGWDGARTGSVIENALRDREVDMILGRFKFEDKVMKLFLESRHTSEFKAKMEKLGEQLSQMRQEYETVKVYTTGVIDSLPAA